jgi:uncharacterized protein (TIGR03437 family)
MFALFHPCGRRSYGKTVLIVAVSALAYSAPRVDLARVPLAFETNRGQADATTKYLARGAGYAIALKQSGATIGLAGSSPVSLRFNGTSPAVQTIEENALPGKVNYFIGSDPRKWQRNVPTYGSVRYAGLYPGIDLVYYGQQGKLEFDFRLSPGADASKIRIELTGDTTPRIDSNGDLVVGGFRQHKPVSYQDLPEGRRVVESAYVATGRNEFSIRLGAYDKAFPLVIDPVLTYATFVGGNANDGIASIKADASGNLYVAGFTSSANFPSKSGVQTKYGGTNSPYLQMQFGDAFVAKLNPAGTAVLYSTYIGGSGDDFAASLAVDSAGNAYVVGATQSTNFPVTSGAVQRTYKGFSTDDNGFYDTGDGFALKLNATGDTLVYATYLGGSMNDAALGVAVDSAGDAIVVGGTNSTDFPTTKGAISSTFQGAADVGSAVAGDAFVTVLNPAGSAFVFSTFLGGRGHDGARGVAVDAQGNIYVCGLTSSNNFPTTTGALQTNFQNSGIPDSFGNATRHGFVTKISAQGSLVYSTFLGGESMDAAAAVAVDSSGAAYVTGTTTSTKFPTTAGALATSYKGRGTAGSFGDIYYGDAFITKLNPAGSSAVYSTYLGGKGDDAGADIAVDASGSAYVTGLTLSTDFPVSQDALQTALGGQGLAPNPGLGFGSELPRNSGDAFLTKLGPSGSLVYSSYFGGDKDDAGLAVAVDSAGNAYVGGITLSAGLKTTSGVLQASFGGLASAGPRGDGFAAKFSFGSTGGSAPAKINLVPGFSGTGTAGSTLSTPLKVEVVDATGADVAGVTVSFSATGAQVNPASAITDSHGQASTTVTLASTAGSGAVTASIAGGISVSAPLTITAPVAGPVVQTLVNAASFQTAVAPGSLITLLVSSVPPPDIFTTTIVPLPTNMKGFRILVNGSAIPMYSMASYNGQALLNAQLPYEVAAGTASVAVEYNGTQGAPYSFKVQPSSPGIFVFGDNRAVVQNIGPTGAVTLNTSDNPVPAGDFIIAYLNGQGPLDNPIPTGSPAPLNPLSRVTLPYSAKLGTTPVDVAFLGMTPTLIAVAQAAIQIPKDMHPGDYTLTITIGGATSNGPVISVGPPRQ